MQHRITHVLYLSVVLVSALGTGAAFVYLTMAHLPPTARTVTPQNQVITLVWCICLIAAFILEEISWRSRQAS
ncbi:MAG TPA: hypothetical protein VLE72_02800 [Candidatus Saccharimonadales bacterium]|nr:hypothetical protein [Candidatus Saccharimonadales bacterium]